MAVKHTSWPAKPTEKKVKPKEEIEEEKKIEPLIREEEDITIATRPKKKQQRRIISIEDA